MSKISKEERRKADERELAEIMRELNARPPEERRKEEERWRQAMERRERERKERRRIIAEGKTCSKCGAELGDAVYRYTPLLERGLGGTRWRSRPTTDQDPICAECAPDWLPELKTMHYTLYMYSHNAQCETCGRDVFFVSPSSEAPPTGRVFCSENCKSERKSKSKRVEPHNISCEVCGTEFVAKRSNAKTCSPACRQKSYRLRRRLQASTAAPARSS
jgi:hypothetical protein